MKKRILGLIMALAMVLLLCAGCGGNTATETAAPESTSPESSSPESSAPTTDEKNYVLDFNTPFAAEGPAGQAAVEFAKEVEERSNGTIKINVFTDGALGNGNESWSSLASGDLDICILGQEGLDAYAPEYTFLISPFLMQDFDHVKAILNSEIGDGLIEKYREAGIETLAFHYRDVRVMAADKEITSADQINGLKLRLPGITTFVEAWSQLGAIPTTVAMSELYTALQTGVAEACEGGYEQMVTLKIYEVQKYIINTEHEYEHCYLNINKALFDGMSENQQTILRECAQKWMAWADELSENSREQYKQECIDGGMTYVEFDKAPFVKALEQFHRDQFNTKWTDYTYDEIMSYAK
ncbi:MAG: TRAP transporter substrate-binding protein [Oscillospiraceae bacterium]